MKTRSAEATIKGYYYQFDSTILNLLKLSSDTDSILVEGIEDIDIQTATENTAIQCKYLSKPKFINSAVREPIILMLDHFLSTTTKLNYVLYAHFENEKQGSEPTLDLVKLKEILAYTENKVKKNYEVEKGITDAQLLSFLKKFKLIFGTEFLAQQKEVLSLIKRVYKCSDFEADVHFYNNALRVILDLAIKKNTADRKVTKGNFLKQIDGRKKLFNEWFVLLRTKEKYLDAGAKNLKETKVMLPSRSKVIVIGKNIMSADNSELPAHVFIENLVTEYYRMGIALNDAKPLTIVFDCDHPTILELKKNLIENQISFNDGHEEIIFSSQSFNLDPVKNTTKGGSKISKSSYLIKVVSRKSLVENIDSIATPSCLLIFSKNDSDLPFSKYPSQVHTFTYCDTLKDIYYLLKK